jgi:hypothetical protein
MAIKISSLREKRRGKILRIAPAEPTSKLDNLKPRPYLLSDPEELVHFDWSAEIAPMIKDGDSP